MRISHNYYSRVIAYEQSLLNGPSDPAREVKNAKNSSASKDSVVITCRYTWEDLRKWAEEHKSLGGDHTNKLSEILAELSQIQIEKGEQCIASLLDEVMKRRGDKSQLDRCVKDEMLEYLKAYANRYDEIMQGKAEGESVVEEMELEKFQKEREEQLKQLDLEFAKIAKLYEKEVHDTVDYAKHMIEYQKEIRSITSRRSAGPTTLDEVAERAKKFLQQDIPNHIANRLIRMKDYIVKQYAKEGKDQFQHRIFF